MRPTLFFIVSTLFLITCTPIDTSSPLIFINRDIDSVHFRTKPYIDAGADVADNHTCIPELNLEVINEVDIFNYGTYNITYRVTDEAGNSSEEIRYVDIVLPLHDYYSQDYSAFDTCTSGNYFYTGLIQDCDCNSFSATVANISNFGLSASFPLPVSGQYNQLLVLDTIKSGVYFNGLGTMSSAADTLFWNYTIQDSTNTDVCRSVWIKN